jgi:heme/copper-type cytochrome/quinol oxidase subunit 1
MDINIFSAVGILILAVAMFVFLAVVLFSANKIRSRMGGSPLENIERGVEASMGGEEEENKAKPSYGSQECYNDCVKRSLYYTEKQYPSCEDACGLRA